MLTYICKSCMEDDIGVLFAVRDGLVVEHGVQRGNVCRVLQREEGGVNNNENNNHGWNEGVGNRAGDGMIQLMMRSRQTI